MDACLSVLVPAGTSYGEFELHVPVRRWGGEDYPQQDEATFRWGRVSFVEQPMPKYVSKFLPQSCEHIDWQSLFFTHEVLDLAYREVHDGADIDWQGPGLFGALEALLSNCTQWCVLFEVQCDEIDMVVPTTVVDHTLTLLRRMLQRGERPRGFVASHC